LNVFEQEIHGKIEQVKAAIALLSFLKKMEHLFTALEINEMECFRSAKVVELKGLFDRLIKEKKNIKLSDSQKHFQDIRTALQHVTSEQLLFFQKVFSHLTRNPFLPIGCISRLLSFSDRLPKQRN